ncbi:MAG: OmpA family protein [Betaproteobacteria bacterium]|nr:MAG: OmpA family protein [Betaproteobacteria bacterium]
MSYAGASAAARKTGINMKNSTPNAATAILLFGAMIVTPALAQTSDAAKPVPGAALRYVGADTRIGVGIDSELDARGEIYQVLQSDENSATLGEIWGARSAGGIKLSHQWANGNKSAVNKLFIAGDQGANSARKLTAGGGQEYQNWFWNTYASKGLSSARLSGTSSSSATRTITGADAGRPFEQAETTTTVLTSFERAYDWGVGARVGHFYENALVRVTAGLDYEWGKYSSKQTSLSLGAEKFFEGSPISVALSGEINRRSGQFETNRNDERGMLMIRYELGAPQSNYRPSKVSRIVKSTERVADPSWVAPPPAPPAPAVTTVAPPAAEPTFRTETRTVRNNTTDAQETYFDLGGTKLKPAAMKELDALVARINAQQPYVELKVTIVGHTCPTGSDRNNVPLSQKRADAVKAYLVSKGVPAAVITATGKAGSAPKYPEVKGQSFRNRRADTDVIIVKESTENVRVAVPAAAAPAPARAPAPISAPATAPMIDREVSREVIEDAPNPWLARALRNSVPHKTSVDTYRWVNTTVSQSLGEKRYINRGPVAVNDSYSLACETPTLFSVLANDTDADGDTLTITNVSGSARGTVAIVGNQIRYTPTAATCGGADSFTYTITDGKGLSSTATVTIAVAAPIVVNKPPVVRDDRYVVPCRTGQPLDVLANDSDPDGDALTIVSITQPPTPRVTISADGKSLNYVPGASCFLTETFTYTVSDGKGGTATATVTLIDP